MCARGGGDCISDTSRTSHVISGLCQDDAHQRLRIRSIRTTCAVKNYTMAEAIDLAIDDCYEPVSKRLRSKRPEEETETPEEEIETPDEETETPEEAEAEKRFVSPKKSLHTYQAGFVPKNTSVNTKWAVKNFIDWQTCYNSRHPKEPCPDDVLLSDNPAELSLWLEIYFGN